MRSKFSRRRFLTIAAAGLAAGPAHAADITRWRGQALGAKASMILTGLSRAEAQLTFRAVEQELERLERIFSLYRESSEISRLNQTGHLSSPSPELLDVLSLSGALHAATGGAFDPTVQPLWLALAQGGDTAPARASIGWEKVNFDTDAVRLAHPGMGLTLNGIAQGYITDRIAALLRRRGLDQILIDMGEIVALGGRPDGRGWQAGIATPDGTVVHHVALRDRGLATSSPFGTVLSEDETIGHIIDPTGNNRAAKQNLVSISAPKAAVADGLSTACCLLDPNKAKAAVTKFPGAEIELQI
jgi:thiamine biosynthesis lipoprotein